MNLIEKKTRNNTKAAIHSVNPVYVFYYASYYSTGLGSGG